LRFCEKIKRFILQITGYVIYSMTFAENKNEAVACKKQQILLNTDDFLC